MKFLEPSPPVAKTVPPHHPTSRIVPVPPSAGFGAGYHAPWQGWAFLWKTPGLRRHAIGPVIVNLVLTGVALPLFLVGGLLLAIQWLRSNLSSSDPFFRQFMAAILAMAGFLVASFILWRILHTVVCGFVHMRLARSVETYLGGPPTTFKELTLASKVVDGLMDLAGVVLINVGLLFLNLLPVIGTLAAIILGLYFNAWAMGREMFSYPLDLRGRRRSEKRAFCRRNRSQTLGLGAMTLIGTFLPPLAPFVLPGAVAGAVRLHRALAKEFA